MGVRLYLEEGLQAGEAVRLSPPQAHYLGQVMRLSAGDRICLFNGQDGEWEAVLETLSKKNATAILKKRRRAQNRLPDLWLLFAPIKRDRIDILVEKATELGVTRLLPVLTERTTVRRVNAERLRAHAVEAAEQTGRLCVPAFEDLAPLARVLAHWPSERRLLFCDETGGGAPVLDALGAAGPGPWAVLIGPEGGFAPAELDALRGLPFVTPASLGPRVLRADTAAIAALTAWQAVLGDWQARPAFRAEKSAGEGKKCRS